MRILAPICRKDAKYPIHIGCIFQISGRKLSDFLYKIGLVNSNSKIEILDIIVKCPFYASCENTQYTFVAISI